MAVTFESLVVGQSYDRPFLAELWGYRGFQAISRGVVTPANSNVIVLFVTEEKQGSLTQYNDYLVGSMLHWEGEEKHSSDARVINAAAAGDEIHLFHRKVHHSPFVYMGIVELEEHNRLRDTPSQFIFAVGAQLELRKPNVVHYAAEGIDISGMRDTERNALARSRIGQGVFRDGLLRLWGGCAVTGYRRPIMLLASHIKPWRNSTNQERLDPYNGLLLQPTIDRLFDKGLVSFDPKGKLMRAPNLTADELVRLGISPEAELRKIPTQTMRYLEYHRDTELGRVDA